MVHRSERADFLVDALGRILADPLTDPIQAEVVAVPTRGVERWIAQRLSHRLGAPPGRDGGVCANLVFPFPATLIGEVMAAARESDPEEDPWRPERAVWPLIDLIDRHIGEPWLDLLAAHLHAASPTRPGGEPGPIRRFSVARHLADLFDHYAVHRPAMVMGWMAGEPGGWQAELWRRLRQQIGTESPAECFSATAELAAREPGRLALPARLSLFGLTRLPESHLQVIEAVAASRDVHLFLLHPSGAAWRKVAGSESGAVLGPRSSDRSAEVVANPLLRSWGRDSREMQLVLRSHAVGDGRHHPVDGPDEHPETLLQRLQLDIRADREPGAMPFNLEPGDTSLRVHSCHGRARQVEVLRDAILHLLAEDRTLEARDVIVMCPDIEAFAPLIHAAFGTADESDPPLRVRLADRALRQTNPLLGVAGRLLSLAGSRVSAPEVVDLAACPPVSRRFGFDQEDLSVLEEWVAGTGIRWGLDAAHRQPWSLGNLDANTWAAGLDRLLLGVAMSEDGCRLFGSTLPYGDMPSSAVDLAGRLAEFIERLAATLRALAGPQPVTAWVEALVGGTESLAVAGPEESWQHEQLHRTLAEVVDEAGAGTARLGRDEIESLLGGRLQGRPTRANFRTGDLTVCTLVPMRSVPHRVVALLGLDDGAFPRHPERDGDDLLLAEPFIGERDARSEDRQLLLDAVLAATEKLIITYSGRDERTNRQRPPCVPVSELLDVIDATVSALDPGDSKAPRQQIVVHHPLQPFDARNFAPAGLGIPGPWSHDRVYLAGALAAGQQLPEQPWLASPLPPAGENVVELDHLVQFAEHPVRAFLRRRLGLYLSDAGDELSDGIPLELDPLERWAVGDRLLTSRLSGVDGVAAEMAERSRGLLPPGLLADRVLEDVRGGVEELLSALIALGFQPGPADSIDVHLDLPDGRTLVGTVPGVQAGTILRCTYSRLAPKHRIAAWVRFLALSAARPDLRASAVTVGRGQGKQPPFVSRFAALPGPDALSNLTTLMDLYDRGMREPLPLPCHTGAVWAEGCRSGGRDDAFLEAGRQWVGSDVVPGEDADAYHVYVWGRSRSLASLMDQEPGPGEDGDDWPVGERSRFGRLAIRLWEPMFAHETLGPVT